MSRDDGFAVMDVSSDIVNDPKVRRLFREFPEQAPVAFVAYMATMGESWKAGHRATVEASWPAYLPLDEKARGALIHVKLIDSRGLVTAKGWRGWFEVALARRAKSRDRWARYNAKREADTASSERGSDAVPTRLPRGSDAVTASSVPPVRPSVPSVPSVGNQEIPPPPTSGGRRKTGTNPRVIGASPRKKATNPRANGKSTRQVRTDQKRGSTKLGEVLRDPRVGLVEAEPNGSGPISEFIASLGE